MIKKRIASKRPGKGPQAIGFVIKYHQPEATAMALDLAGFCLQQGRKVYFAQESARVSQNLRKSVERKFHKHIYLVPKQALVLRCDLIVVLGGDGTYLSIARLMRDRSVPVMGVNMGQLGFLTEFKRSEALSTLGAILEGEKPIVEERALLEVTLTRKGKTVFQGPVVNDVVVSKGAIARIIGLEIAVNGKGRVYVNNQAATASVLRQLAPELALVHAQIMEPTLEALILTPICPHSLTQRPLVISDRSEIRITLSHRPGDVLLTLDGQDAVDMKEDDCVIIRRFKKHSLKTISSPTRDYYSLLREKLKFGVRD